MVFGKPLDVKKPSDELEKPSDDPKIRAGGTDLPVAAA
jgi:hypothetical protein